MLTFVAGIIWREKQEKNDPLAPVPIQTGDVAIVVYSIDLTPLLCCIYFFSYGNSQLLGH